MQRDYGFGKFLQLLCARRFPDWLRYGATLALVILFVALRLSTPLKEARFLLFIPAVLGASLAFGLGPGLVATALTTIVSVILLIEPTHRFYIPRTEVFSVAIYVVISFGIALLCHVLRTTLSRAAVAERSKTVLLEELAHRTKNDLQMVASLLSLQARTLPDADARAALEGATSRVLTIAKLHNKLRSDGRDGVVEMRDYLGGLCSDIREAYGELRPVVVRIEADHVVLGTSVAAPIGLILNELVTNAFKYAFPDNREGVVSVTFRQADDGGFVLAVRDNGVGSAGTEDGLGSRLIRLMVQQFGGRIERLDAAPGTLVQVIMPAQ